MRSDGFSLFAEKTGTRKNGLYVKDKKGKESKIEGDYPKWRSVIPTKDTNSSKVDVQSLRDFLSSVKANNAKDFRDGKARVIIRTDYGDYLYNAKLLSQVADFMEKHGIDELQFEGRYGKMVAQNKSAIGLLMPMFFDGSGLEELEAFGYDIRTDKRGERFSLPEREQKRDDEYKKAHDEMQRAKVANSYDKGIDVNYSENGKTKIMRLHTPVSDVENLKATAIKPHSMSRDDQKRLYQSFKPETNVSTGETVEFYTSAFGKNHRENGLFEKIIPQIRELFKESKLIYSEPEQLAGETRRDGTNHKVHRGITGYGNYLNKANIDEKEYYVRFTVQRKKNESGLHSSFVSNVELYNNPVAVAYNPSSNGGRRLDYDRITDAKLKTYFEKSKENANKFSQLTDNPEYTKIISDSESRMREILDEVKRERGSTYINNEKVHDFLFDQSPLIGAAAAKPEPHSDAKLVNSSELNKLLGEKLYVRTNAFKNWFGDWEKDPENASKIVDDNGEPLVVYHASPEHGFTTFKDNAFFSKNREYTDRYEKGGDTYEVYLNIRKPFDIRNPKDRKIFTEYRNGHEPARTKSGAMDWAEFDYYDKEYEEGLQQYLMDNYPNEYDGFILDEGADGGYGNDVKARGLSYVPFYPEQIKSATDNVGTFDRSNKDIRFSLPEEDRKVSSAHDAMSRVGLREIVGKDGYDAFLDDVGRRLRDDVKKEVSSSVGREFLDDVLGVATNAQHTGRGRSYEERRRDTVGLTIGLLLERIW